MTYGMEVKMEAGSQRNFWKSVANILNPQEAYLLAVSTAAVTLFFLGA
jgi:hypothetical protein